MRPGEIGLRVDELDRRRAIGSEQLFADAIAFLGGDQALCRRRERVCASCTACCAARISIRAPRKRFS